MRALIAMAAASVAFAVHADTLEIYRSIDAQGRVTFGNVKPKHDDYDVVKVEFQSQPHAPAIVPAAATTHARPVDELRDPPAAARPIAATLRVVAFPSLRLAATAGESPGPRRRRGGASTEVALRLDPELRSWSRPD